MTSHDTPSELPLMEALAAESYPYRLRDGEIVDAQMRRVTVSGNSAVAQLLNTIVEQRNEIRRLTQSEIGEGLTPRWREKDPDSGDDLIELWKKRPRHSDEYAAAEIIEQLERELADALKEIAKSEEKQLKAMEFGAQSVRSAIEPIPCRGCVGRERDLCLDKDRCTKTEAL